MVIFGQVQSLNLQKEVGPTEWLRETTKRLDIFLFSAHRSLVFYFQCSVYWWKGSVRF